MELNQSEKQNFTFQGDFMKCMLHRVTFLLCVSCKCWEVSPHAEDQPRLNQGIRRRDGVGEDQETIA